LASAPTRINIKQPRLWIFHHQPNQFTEWTKNFTLNGLTRQLPIQQEDRTIIVDILRGFALFGVLLGNFSGMITNNVPNNIINSHATAFDHFLDTAHELFVSNKFLTLFAILFGYGFGVIMERLKKKEINTTSFFLRRMFWLFIFGFLNLALWNGDILHVYAIAGILLLLFRKLNARTILWCSVLFLFVVPLLIRLYQRFWLHYSIDESLVDHFYLAYKYGSLKDVIVVNYQSYPQQWIYSWVDLRDISEILGKFLLGYFVLRQQILTKLHEHYSLIRKTWLVSLPIMIIYLCVTILSDKKIITTERYLLFPFFRIGVLATTLFYATSIIHLFVKNRWYPLMQAFQNLGRMTLTNYLMQTIIYVLLFYHIGFGLLGDFSFTIVWLLSFIIYFLQSLFSKWWLSKFYYGPIEWVWRQLCYQQRFPIKKK
jgi:uncharacterized protein